MNNFKRNIILLSIYMLVFVLFTGTGCQSEITITQILLEDAADERIEASLLTNKFKEFKGRFTVDPKYVDCDDLELVFDNEELVEEATIEEGIIKDDFVYKIKPKYNGKLVMYIQSKDGSCKSETKTFYFIGGNNQPTQTIKIGDVAVDYYYNVEFKVTNVQNRTSFSNGYVSINTTNNFLLIEIEILNKGQKAFYINPYNFVVKKFENNKHVSTFEHDPRTYRFENAMSSYDLNYGIKKSFVILYEIDEATTQGDYRLFCQGASSQSGVSICLK